MLERLLKAHLLGHCSFMDNIHKKIKTSFKAKRTQVPRLNPSLLWFDKKSPIDHAVECCPDKVSIAGPFHDLVAPSDATAEGLGHPTLSSWAVCEIILQGWALEVFLNFLNGKK